MKKYIIFIVILFIIFIINIFGSKNIVKAPVEDELNQDYKNTTYVVDDQKVKLVNGVSEEKIPDSLSSVTTTYFGNDAKGDLNGDGKEDVVFILMQNGGGTGTFYFLTVALKTDSGFQGTNSILLGDRIAPQNIDLKNGIITVNYADRLWSESFTTPPSIGVSRNFKIVDDVLVEIKRDEIKPPTISPVACTMEAKICPDGSAVGRSGPNCEFTKCPGEK